MARFNVPKIKNRLLINSTRVCAVRLVGSVQTVSAMAMVKYTIYRTSTFTTWRTTPRTWMGGREKKKNHLQNQAVTRREYSWWQMHGRVLSFVPSWTVRSKQTPRLYHFHHLHYRVMEIVFGMLLSQPGIWTTWCDAPTGTIF